MLTNTTCNPLQIALSANATTASFTAKVPLPSNEAAALALLAAKDSPSTTGFRQVGTNNLCESILELMPYATAADLASFSFRVWGWKEFIFPTTGIMWLVPKLLAEFDCIAGDIAAGFASSTFFCDTITLADGDAGCLIVSPGDELPGWINIDLRGCKYWHFDPAKNSGTATAMNALWSLIS